MRYLRVFLSVYEARLSKDFSLPLSNQLIQLSGGLCFFFLHLLAYRLLLSKFTFSGWTLPQSWVLLFTFEIFTYLGFYLIWNGLNKTVQDINTGRFDMIIAKPVSSQFVAMFRGGGIHNLISAALGFIFLCLTIISSHLSVGLISLLLYFIFIAASLWTFYCFAVCFITLNFKYGRLTATTGVAFQIQEVYKYPSTLYAKLPLLYGLIPLSLSLFTTLPAAVVLFKPLPWYFYLIYILFLIFITWFSSFAWNTGLRSYSSAGS